MGMTQVDVEVANPSSPDSGEMVTFLVDSGPIYSIAPSEVLERLGIKPLTTQTFILTDGEKIERRKGVAVFRYGERVGGADIVFGEPGDANLLGALTLEALALSLDPVKRELRPLPLMMARTG
jgi:predicted aspartyl protease